MGQKPETKIVTEITDWIESKGGSVLKVFGNDVQRAGEPDLIGGIYKPKWGFIHFAVEVKMPGEEARPLQLYRLREWKRVGFVTGVAHSLEEFNELIGYW